MTAPELRDLLEVSHVVYHSSRLGASPSSDPYIQLTYPDSWIKRYLQMGYVNIDPVLREGFLRTLPFDWSELEIKTAEEMAFLMDALAHDVGPRGYSIPVRSLLKYLVPSRIVSTKELGIRKTGWPLELGSDPGQKSVVAK